MIALLITKQDFELEVYRRIYFGGIHPDLRKKVWPYLLGHYKWDFGPAEQAAADARVQEAYEHKLSDWMAIEAIVRQRDKEINAANIAKLSGNGTSLRQFYWENFQIELEHLHQSYYSFIRVLILCSQHGGWRKLQQQLSHEQRRVRV